MRFDHIAIGVADIDESLELFEKRLGTKILRRSTLYGTTTPIAFVEDQESHVQVELIQRAKDAVATVEHLAFRVEDVDKKFEEFKTLGFAVVREPHDIPAAKARSALLRDRTGLRVQLIAYL